MSLRDGTLAGPYETISLLGIGGLSEVYKARDTRSGLEVVIKILTSTASSDLERRRRFGEEVRALAALKHPNIMAILDAGTHEGQPFLVTELLEGEALRERLQRGPLPPVLAVGIAIQIARGLASAHTRGIVHRDLKPSNLFLTVNNLVKILDFGIARIARGDGMDPPDATLSDKTAAGVILGTAGYVSPEQIRGGTADHRSDVFSLGVVLTEMLTGKQTFPGDSVVERGYATMNADPDVPSHLAPELARVIRRCLAKEPFDRYQSARDLAFHLDGIGLGPADDEITGQHEPPSPDSALAAHTTYRRLTFRNGMVSVARFAPGGMNVVFSAKWGDEPFSVYSMLPERPESQVLTPPGTTLFALSSSGELAVSLRRRYQKPHVARGTLARLPLVGGTPRELLEEAEWADFAPGVEQLLVVRTVDEKNRIEFPVGRVLYETAGWVSNPRFSPSGKLVAFLDHPMLFDSCGSLVVVGLDQPITVLLADWSHVIGVAWSPRGDEVWFTGYEDKGPGALHAVALDGRARPLLRAPGELRLHDVSPDGRVLLTMDPCRRVARGRFPSGDDERDVSWLDGTRPTDLSSDGTTMVFTEGWEAAAPTVVSYLRKTDGSPAEYLGEGVATSISPDGRWVIMVQAGPIPKPMLLPTGHGAPRRLNFDVAARAKFSPRWLPDGRHVLFVGADDSGELYVCLHDVETSESRKVTPPGFRMPFLTGCPSPDGRRFVALDAAEHAHVFSVDGGQPATIPGWSPRDRMIQWTADGKSLFACRRDELRLAVFKVDLRSGARELWQQFAPGDPAGVESIDDIQVTPDGRYYAYSYTETCSTLFVVSNVDASSPPARPPHNRPLGA